MTTRIGAKELLDELLENTDAVGVRIRAEMGAFADDGETMQRVKPPTFAMGGEAGYGKYCVNANGEVEIDTPERQNRRASEILHRRYGDVLPENWLEGPAGCRGPKRIGELGHRAADAGARSSGYAEDVDSAFRAWNAGKAEPLAKLDPTSLVFGAFNSRGAAGAGGKISGMYAARITGFGAEPVRSGAQYRGFVEDKETAAKALQGELDDEEGTRLAEAMGGEGPAKHGLTDQPIPRSDKQGKVPEGGEHMAGVRCSRITLVSTTSAIRARGIAGMGGTIHDDAERAAAERTNRLCARYTLALALLAQNAEYDHDLRQGAQLLETDRTTEIVYRNGTTKAIERIEPGEIHDELKLAAQAVLGADAKLRTERIKTKKLIEDLEKAAASREASR